jgi:uncharacterized protein YbjT (DUF2867 family)
MFPRVQPLSQAKHVTVVSVTNVINAPNSTFGKQFAPLEAHTAASGLPYTIVRLPAFVENNWGNLESIKTQGKIYGSVRADTVASNVAVNDVGVAIAAVYGDLSKHVNKTYTLAGTQYSSADLAKAFSAATGKTVEYVQIPAEAVKAALLKFMPEWQVDGLLEVLALQDAGDAKYTDDFPAITGTPSTTIGQWTAQVGAAFK